MNTTGNQVRRYNIHAYGDSLSLPRYSDGIPASGTYLELVEKIAEHAWSGISVRLYNRSLGGATIRELHGQFKRDVGYFSPDERNLLIIQSGIVDCAPRPIPLWLRAVVSRLPRSLRAGVVRVLHKNRPRIQASGFSWRITGPTEFERQLRDWVSLAAKEFRRVLIVNVAPTTTAIGRHSPGLESSIRLYNQIIESVVLSAGLPNVRVVDVWHHLVGESALIESFISPADGHHLTLRGHEVYAELIIKAITEWVAQEEPSTTA